MDYLYGFRNLNFVTSFDHDFMVWDVVHVFIVGIVFFIFLRWGLQTTSLGTPLYLYSSLVVASRNSVLNGSLKLSIPIKFVILKCRQNFDRVLYFVFCF